MESGEEGITFEPAAWVKCRINEKGFFEAYGEGWSSAPQGGIAFEEKTKRLDTAPVTYGVLWKG